MGSMSNTEAVLLELRGVQRAYGEGDARVLALNGVDLRIDRGEFVAITGPSGSGKSTAVSILGCLEAPSAGEYLIEGQPVTALPKDVLPALRNALFGFVFQNYNLLTRTSATDNVSLPLVYGDVPAVERVARARAALAEVGLAGREEARPNQLSGGQQQRVAIARAIVNRPQILIADEPTGNLDTRTGTEIMQLLKRLNAEAGITIILVTHDASCAAWAKRQVTVRDGRIEADVRREGGAA
jgi:putative ABC transport system ATP-binding protein